MKYKNALLCAATLLGTVVGRGAGVTVHDAPGWRPATEEQVATLKKQSGAEVIDFSLFSEGGAGSAISLDAHMQVGREFAEGSVKGYIGSLSKGGHMLVSQEPAQVGSLRGYRVVSQGKANNKPIRIITYLVYTERELYTIAIYQPGDGTNAEALATNYLSRVTIAPTVRPANIDRNSAFEYGQQIGRSIVKGGAIFGGIGILVLGIFLYIKRRREMTPPPLPP